MLNDNSYICPNMDGLSIFKCVATPPFMYLYAITLCMYSSGYVLLQYVWV